MKKYLLLLSISLVLTACSNEEPEVTTENEESEEIARLKEENEELKKQQAVEEEENQEVDDEQAEEKTESSKDEEGSTNVDDTESEINDRSALIFDIDSPEVQAYIEKSGNYDNEGNFLQDAISVGMTQSEIEALYGVHDYIIPSPTTVAATIYENIAVVYEERGPYVPNTDSNIDPDNNKAEAVLYFPNLTTEAVLAAMGTPNQQLTNLMGTQNYIYDGDSSNGEWGTIILSENETPEGLKIGPLSISNDERSSKDDSTAIVNEDSYFGEEAYNEGFPITLTLEKDYFIYDTLRNFIFKSYLNSLSDYYNDVDDEILNITTGAALQQVQENKSSGSFENYQNLTGSTLSVVQISENEYSVTVDRNYSHASSNGQQSTQVTYTVVDTDGMLKVSGF